MAYNLYITENADKLVNKLVAYLLYKLKNRDAAIHLTNELDNIYGRLEDNPFQFPESLDSYLQSKGYREAYLKAMSYKVVFDVRGSDVYVLGVFHDKEKHERKL